MRKAAFALAALSVGAVVGAEDALAGGVFVQCPGDTKGVGVPGKQQPANVKCMHIAGGDGMIRMADGKDLYIFGFSNVTGADPRKVLKQAKLGATFPSPTITLDEGDEFYLTLTNVGFVLRPDLSDPHTVHWHGFPQAASVFDGVPEASIAPNPVASFTYYYKVQEPGTFMWHCHMEATEHMQMGMLGNLYVRPKQNKLPNNTDLNGYTHKNGDRYVYNDGDGSTRYDVEYALQLGSFDPDFHDASLEVQPLPFALMKDRYPMINGRGYPDTANPDPIYNNPAATGMAAKPSQPLSSLIQATRGQRVLLRLSNLNVTTFHTVGIMGIPMTVVGRGSRILRGGGVADGKSLYYRTNSVTLGGGEAVDVLLDTTDVPAGTYFLYAKNLQHLSNDDEDFGGMMTEIVISEPSTRRARR